MKKFFFFRIHNKKMKHSTMTIIVLLCIVLIILQVFCTISNEKYIPCPAGDYQQQNCIVFCTDDRMIGHCKNKQGEYIRTDLSNISRCVSPHPEFRASIVNNDGKLQCEIRRN